MRKSTTIAAALLLSLAASAHAQEPTARVNNSPPTETRGHEIYVSWGYNGDSYRPADLHISQPQQGNDFTLHDVSFHDSKGWNDGLFAHSLTVPQYTVQFGYFIRKNTAFEVNFVHPKAIVTQGQTVRMTGTFGGKPVDKDIVLTEDVLRYQLNNGANFVLFNIVQRFPLIREPGKTGSVAALAKAGMGFLVPHSENTVFGQPNVPGYQVSGPDVGAELAVRVHLFRALYAEFCEKGVFARYRGLNVNGGRADQNLWAHVTSLGFGVSFWAGKE